MSKLLEPLAAGELKLPNRVVMAPLRGLARGMRRPVEIAAIHDQATNRGTVPAQVLRAGVDHHRGAVLERPHKNWGSRVVDDERNAEAPSDGGHLRNREDRQLGVRQCLA